MGKTLPAPAGAVWINGGPHEKYAQEVQVHPDLLSAVMLVLCGLLCLIPAGHHQPLLHHPPRAGARRTRWTTPSSPPWASSTPARRAARSPCSPAPYAGQTAPRPSNYQNSALDKDKLFEARRPRPTRHGADGRQRPHRHPHRPLPHRRGGVASSPPSPSPSSPWAARSAAARMVSLVSSAVLVWKLLIPLLAATAWTPSSPPSSPCILLTAVIDLLVAGWTKTVPGGPDRLPDRAPCSPAPWPSSSPTCSSWTAATPPTSCPCWLAVRHDRRSPRPSSSAWCSSPTPAR